MSPEPNEVVAEPQADPTTQAPAPEPTAAPQQPAQSLDELLAEYDTPSTQPQPQVQQPVEPQPQAPAAAPDPGLEQRIAHIEYKEAVVEARKAIDSAVSTVKQFADMPNVDNDLVEGALQVMAARDPRFNLAFQQRLSHPARFRQVLEVAAQEVKAKLAPIAGSKLTADSQAVRRAVTAQGDTQTTSDEKSNRDLNAMSDAEFKQYKESLG